MTNQTIINNPASHPQIILASTSRYRRELLERLCIPFKTIKPQVDETPLEDEAPALLTQRLALAKAHAVAEKYPQDIVIGSDQVADFEGHAIGKPGNYENAFKQLKRMNGHNVVFQTAVAVVCKSNHFELCSLVPVKVIFRTLTDGEIERYLKTEEPYDCAGSAKSEGLGISLLQAIENQDPTALIGLPLIATAQLLRQAGLVLP